MSLSAADLDNIRAINREGNQAIEADVREIYHILSSMRRSMITDKHFQRLPLREKLLTLNTELVIIARQAGIELPR